MPLFPMAGFSRPSRSQPRHCRPRCRGVCLPTQCPASPLVKLHPHRVVPRLGENRVPGPAGTGTGPVQVCDRRVSVPRVPRYPVLRYTEPLKNCSTQHTEIPNTQHTRYSYQPLAALLYHEPGHRTSITRASCSCCTGGSSCCRASCCQAPQGRLSRFLFILLG